MAAPQTAPADKPKPLGVRATAEQRRILAEAAKREHRSVSSFVLQAALGAAYALPPLPQSAETPILPKPKPDPEEVQRILAELRAAYAASPMAGRDPVAELIAERRAEALRE